MSGCALRDQRHHAHLAAVGVPPEANAVLVEVWQVRMLDGVHQVKRVVRPAVGGEVFGGVLVIVRACIIAEIGVDGHVAVGCHKGRLPVRIRAATCIPQLE